MVAVAALAGNAVDNNMRLGSVPYRFNMTLEANLFRWQFQQSFILAAMRIMTLDAAGTLK